MIKKPKKTNLLAYKETLKHFQKSYPNENWVYFVSMYFNDHANEPEWNYGVTYLIENGDYYQLSEIEKRCCVTFKNISAIKNIKNIEFNSKLDEVSKRYNFEMKRINCEKELDSIKKEFE